MRIPDNFLKCVAFIGKTVKPNPTYEYYEFGGTGFLVRHTPQGSQIRYVYLVTARHTVEKITGSAFVIRTNRKGGGTLTITCQPDDKWYFHPTAEDAIDIALIPIVVPDEADILTVPFEMFLSDDSIAANGIGPGDEVLMTGLFTPHQGNDAILPIVRVGNVAMMPTGPVSGITGKGGKSVDAEVYLVECRSVGGLSGSPVFVRRTRRLSFPDRANGGEVVIAAPADFYLMGLAHGHWSVQTKRINEHRIIEPKIDDDKVNLGIALVVPAKHIIETINHPDLATARATYEAAEGRKVARPELD